MSTDTQHLKQTVIILAHLSISWITFSLFFFFFKWPYDHIEYYGIGSPWFIEHVTDVSLAYADFPESLSISYCGSANIWVE